MFVDALPRVGIEGTVRWRHVTDALGKARAKSGHIENVNALTGYVQTRRHGRVAFAILVNDRRADDGPVDEGIDRALDVWRAARRRPSRSDLQEPSQIVRGHARVSQNLG